MIDIDSLTVKELREISKLAGCCAPKEGAKPFPFQPGECVLIRTVTMIQTGKIESIGRDWIELRDAAWIADTGRFADTLSKGTCNEV